MSINFFFIEFMSIWIMHWCKYKSHLQATSSISFSIRAKCIEQMNHSSSVNIGNWKKSTVTLTLNWTVYFFLYVYIHFCCCLRHLLSFICWWLIIDCSIVEMYAQTHTQLSVSFLLSLSLITAALLTEVCETLIVVYRR